MASLPTAPQHLHCTFGATFSFWHTWDFPPRHEHPLIVLPGVPQPRQDPLLWAIAALVVGGLLTAAMLAKTWSGVCVLK